MNPQSRRILTIDIIKNFNFSQNNRSKKDTAALQLGLQKLGFVISPGEIQKRELGDTTKRAIKTYQASNGLQATGEFSEETIKELKIDLEHRFYAYNKTRIEKIHNMLNSVGIEVDAVERNKRIYGSTTEKAIKEFQRKVRLKRDGILNEDLVNILKEEEIKVRFATKTQIGKLQRLLLRTGRIAKLDPSIDRQELKEKNLGPTTKALISAIQTKYRLQPTGDLDRATYEKVLSVSASRRVSTKLLEVKSPENVSRLKRALRLNAINNDVGELQKALSFLRYKINEKEFKTRTFGKTTREAVIEYQRSASLPVTGHVDGQTLKKLNQYIEEVNPASTNDSIFRLKGSVRDSLWVGKPNVKVQIWERILRGGGQMLAERVTLPNGFFDIPYDPPRNPFNGQVKKPFHLQIKILDNASNNEIDKKLIFNPTMISWINFTDGDEPYRGESEYELRMKTVIPALNNVPIEDIEETEQGQEVTQAAINSGLAPEDIMKLAISHRISKKINKPEIKPEVCYAFIRQNLPPSLPSDLIASSNEWTEIEGLVELVTNGLIFMEGDLQSEAFDNAIKENYIPISVGIEKNQVMATLSSLKQVFTLEKPILVGNGNLKSVLQSSQLNQQHYNVIANTFMKHGCTNSEFWTEIKSRSIELGGDIVIKDLENTISLGVITNNHIATLSFLKARINDPNDTRINSVRDMAKLTPEQAVNFIDNNGGQVPDWINGNTNEEKIKNYADLLLNQSELLFPSVALVSAVGGSDQHDLTKIKEISNLIDANEDLDLKYTNIDKYVNEKQLNVPKEVVSETKVLQRVHRIAPTVAVGRVLIDEKIHHSASVISLGRENFVKLLENKGVDKKAALTIYSNAEFQYAEILARIGEYRFELNKLNPKAIVKYTYTDEEKQEFLDAIPDWETLFGSLDFCDCAHCQSVYSPSAYLADVLNFLENHTSEQPPKSVKDILFERRPDIGNIKLNCDNSDIPLPYIDLVCEILENAVPSLPPNSNFSFQTTKLKEELKAFPENVRKEAYEMLKMSNYPMDTSLNLWQEESRTFLQHLNVPWFELMEKFQSRSGGVNLPSDTSIAGEFWKMSSHETDIVVTRANSTPHQDEFWGFDSTRNKVAVSEFLQHAKIDYADLLELLSVKWINPPGAPNNITIENSLEMCNTEKQNLTNLTVDKFDQIHRLLRLWRHTSDWRLWELDLLLRCPRIGNGNIDSDTLMRLKQFKQVQTKLRLSFESTLSFYHQINTEIRLKPDEPQREILPLYFKLFQNQAVTNPVNEKFALPLSGAELLSNHKATLMAALALRESDLVQLLEKTDDKLNLANLTTIFNYATLAKSLKIPISDLIVLQDLSEISDIFATPEDSLYLIEILEWIKGSGLQIQELDYLLNFRQDSPYGMREETVTQYILNLRESLRNHSLDTRVGQIISQIAASFSIADEQSKVLMENLELQGQKILQHLNDDKLIEKNTNDEYTTEVTRANFQKIYDSYFLLHKTTLLIKKHKIEYIQDLEWLVKKFNTFNSLNFSSLPVNGNPVAPLFPTWLVLRKWLYFELQYPEPESTSLRQIFDTAATAVSSKDDILKGISDLTQWKLEDLKSLDSAWGLQHGPNSDYTNIDSYIRFWKSFNLVKLIGAGAGSLLGWRNRDDDTNEKQFRTSQEIKQAAKSKYDYSVWLSKVVPLQDELREKKRTGLTNYLMEFSIRTEPKEIIFNGKRYHNPKYWSSTSDLLGYFLTDVEMSSCQPTSRIKQAMSSIQMFVQRSFLNLEQPYVEVSREEMDDNVSLNSWKQWKWMKNYRIWEANRKVFLYPENWIEPELRDDKSPFYIELENEILQNEITKDNVEASLLHYLQKVLEVSRLDIAGIYHELDDDNPYDNLPPSINILHVIGRTKSQPAVYYYRQFDLNYKVWTGWEKVELDITGDHVTPVVYNRKLHLFWLVFTEKTQRVKKQPGVGPSDKPSNIPDPPKILEIQLAWSTRKDRGWTPKKVSRHKLVHPWQRPTSSYNFKTRYKSRENLLWLDIYISTSLDFNNSTFYDPYSGEPRRLTGVYYGENIRPWHSSSFVFDGDIVDIKLKPLPGQYRILSSSGQASDNLVPTTSYNYIHDGFGEDGKVLNRLEGGYEIAPRLLLPDGMHYDNTHLANNKYTPNSNRLNVLESNATKSILDRAHSPFELVFSQDKISFDTAGDGLSPFFYQDPTRSFFVKPEWKDLITGCNQITRHLKYSFYAFYHPYAALFVREINRSGLEGLLNRKIQLNPQTFYPGNSFSFTTTYAPKPLVVPDETTEKDIIDFNQYGAYSIYNWETFFHIPFMIACKLSLNQQFEEAMRWFHFVFDPTNTEAFGIPQKYWITKPFFDQNTEDYRRQRIEKLLENIDNNIDQVRAWKNNPFKPHLIARYRPVAYQKAVVMKYIDNLIAWGDQLFRRDTTESINEATILYVLAYELLGPRPIKVLNTQHRDLSYNELTLESKLDPFGNKKVEVLMENLIPTLTLVTRTKEGAEPLPKIDIFYFCIPNNDILLQYWNKVEDRLFKIRHCMNIEGVKRILPLFEPPIDPMLLVKAAAAGVDLSSVLNDTFASQGQYRYRVLVLKSLDFCNEVKNIGDKLLLALERKDAEELSQLRSVHEIELYKAIRKVREEQVNEANEIWESAQSGIDILDKKIEYYDSIPRMNEWEIGGLIAHSTGIASEIVATILNTVGGAAHLYPTVEAGAAGAGGSPVLTLRIGGDNVGKSSTNFAALFQGLSSILHQSGQLLESQGAYQRRDEENKFQKELAEKEKVQLQKQIEAARIRHSISEKELDNTDLQIEQSKSIEEYMHSKYTNQQLYEWMLSQLATVYFQSYQLAYEMAKRAERSMKFELGIQDTSFIEFGYWDSLKKGLLAGEKLMKDIHRMESFYYEENKREREITKHISLAKIAPLSLIMLKETGNCAVTLPEWLYDMDYPGYYRRRLKSVSVTIPCVVGPYTSLNCTLSLTNNAVRISDDVTGDYGDPLTAAGDVRFVKNQVPITSIATSHGQNDSGMFELNFSDERYLPFEGAGAVSEWQIDLPKENNQFDFATISDAILHVKYTTISSGSIALVNAARSNLDEILPTNGLTLILLRNDFSNEWHKFLHPPDENSEQILSFSLKVDHLPFYVINRSINKDIFISKIDLVIDTVIDGTFEAILQLPENTSSSNDTLTKDPNFGGMPHLEKTTFPPMTKVLGNWILKLKKSGGPDFKHLKEEDINNAFLVLRFSIQ